MSDLPLLQSDFSPLNDLLFSAIRSRLLTESVALRCYDVLHAWMPAQQVANALGTDPDNTELLLDALCACGLLQKENGAYQNTALAAHYLVTGKPTYLGDWLLEAQRDWRVCESDLANVLQGKVTAPEAEEDMNSAEYCERFTAAHAATSLGGIASDMADHIAAIRGFAQCRSLLDLGGGPGVNAMAVLQRQSELHAVVFDRPEIARIAERNARQWGFAQRLSGLGGNYLKDDLGTGYDMIMVTDTLYYAQDDVARVLRKCYDALAPGGFMVALHSVLTHERTQPPMLVIGMLCESLRGQGSLPDAGFLCEPMRQAGFRDTHNQFVTVGGSPIEMNLGYKD